MPPIPHRKQRRVPCRGSYRCPYGDQTSVGEMRQLICNPIGYHDVIPAPILWKKLYFACHRISVHDPDAVGCGDPSSFSHNLGYRDRPGRPVSSGPGSFSRTGEEVGHLLLGFRDGSREHNEGNRPGQVRVT